MAATWSEPKYFEDLAVGDHFITTSRTITETDIVHYVMLSGSFEELFTSREHAAKSVFKGRVAQGNLTRSLPQA